MLEVGRAITGQQTPCRSCGGRLEISFLWKLLVSFVPAVSIPSIWIVATVYVGITWGLVASVVLSAMLYGAALIFVPVDIRYVFPSRSKMAHDRYSP